jgi:predicted nucleic acid-binding protein
LNLTIDTNALLRWQDTRSAQHLQVTAALANLIDLGYTSVVFPQMLYEIWTVATRPVAVNGFGFGVVEASALLDSVGSLMRIVPDPPNLYFHWRQLIATHQVLGKKAHDAQIVAAMQLHGIEHILTYNDSDFARYPKIKPIHPDNVGTSA